MEQIMLPFCQHRQKTSLRQVFQEFKFKVIYRNPQNKQTPKCSNGLKQILADICLKNKMKKKKIVGMKSKKQSQRCQKPLKINMFSIEGTTNIPMIQHINESIGVQQHEKQILQNQIKNISYSLAKIKAQVDQIKRDIDTQLSKQQQIKHISYLSQSIQRQTDISKKVSQKSYSKLLQMQQSALNSLKKYRVDVIKQNEDLEIKSNVHKQIGAAYKSSVQTVRNIKIELQCTNMKINEQFINKLDELMMLFHLKQPDIEDIKIQKMTRVRLKRIHKDFLPPDRVKMHNLIQKFQQNHEIKLQSIQVLILHIYSKIVSQNQSLQSQCARNYQIKQDLLEEFQSIAQHHRKATARKRQVSLLYQLNQVNSAVYTKKIHQNSVVLVNVVNVLHDLLGKFKYLFSMCLTLNLQKRNFQQLLLQIGHLYKSDQVFFDNGDISEPTNFQEINQMLQSIPMRVKQLVLLIFADLRYTFIFRSNWLLLQNLKDIEPDQLEKTYQSLCLRCDQIYDSKLKLYSLLFINSVKALSMNKYQKRLIKNSQAHQDIFLVKKNVKNINVLQQDTQRIQTPIGSQKLQEQVESLQQIQIFQIKDCPKKIIRSLQEMKRGQKQKIKPFQYNPDQVYLYERRIAVPKYAL